MYNLIPAANTSSVKEEAGDKFYTVKDSKDQAVGEVREHQASPTNKVYYARHNSKEEWSKPFRSRTKAAEWLDEEDAGHQAENGTKPKGEGMWPEPLKNSRHAAPEDKGQGKDQGKSNTDSNKGQGKESDQANQGNEEDPTKHRQEIHKRLMSDLDAEIAALEEKVEALKIAREAIRTL